LQSAGSHVIEISDSGLSSDAEHQKATTLAEIDHPCARVREPESEPPAVPTIYNQEVDRLRTEIAVAVREREKVQDRLDYSQQVQRLVMKVLGNQRMTATERIVAIKLQFMLDSERRRTGHSILRISISDLAQQSGTTASTVRRFLAAVETRSLLKRLYELEVIPPEMKGQKGKVRTHVYVEQDAILLEALQFFTTFNSKEAKSLIAQNDAHGNGGHRVGGGDAAYRALLSGIPSELRILPQWVTYQIRLYREGGKQKKKAIPFDPKTGETASTTDPSSWSTFDDAMSALKRGEHDGIGFVFTHADSYTGVDLDGCRDTEIGEIDSATQAIIRELDSYTEVSPSGTGVHIIVRGKLPPGPRRRSQVEMYDQGRYFTVTGQRVPGTPDMINDRDDVVRGLYERFFGIPSIVEPRTDAEVVQRALRSRNGERFLRLWEGNWEGNSKYPTQSEADLAFISMLGYWTDWDRSQMDRLFRQSQLYRPKWDEKHHSGGRTYGEMTLDKALQSQL
jgi:hypothetical protein